MLTLELQKIEAWNEQTETFEYRGCSDILVLEHSLISISKWEQKWKIPFLKPSTLKSMTDEQMMDYIHYMTVNHPPSAIYESLKKDDIERIAEYCGDTATATIVRKTSASRSSGEILTSEVIYAYMVLLEIPFECQKWNINRLLTLMQVINAKQQSPKKMSKNAVLSQNQALNTARRKRNGSRG